MTWNNPFGSLWATPTCSGRFFSSDSEAIYQTDKVGVHTAPPVERFPSTTEGIHKLLDKLFEYEGLVDALRDDLDIYGVHQALGLNDDLRDVSVYDWEDLLGLANEYESDLLKVIDILYMDILRSYYSQKGAALAIDLWSSKAGTNAEAMLRSLSEDGESHVHEGKWYAEEDGWIAA